MVIECNEINQVYSQLMMAFQDCNKIKNEDLRKMLDLIMAVNVCSNGGPSYNTLESFTYTPLEDEIISFLPETFHSISLVVSNGEVIYDGITLSTSAAINLEFTSLNQYAFTFTVKAGSTVLVNLIKEDV